MTDTPSPASGTALACSSPRPGRRTSRTAFRDLPPEPDDPLLGFAPYLHKAPRRNSITPGRQRGFIAALAATGIVTQAARQIGASLEALYRLRNMPGAEGFAAAWEAAVDRGIARLEDCALERALAGEERVVVRGGEVVATWRRYDTQLLMFLLRQRRPRRFAAGGAHFANLKPGHPVHDRLRREWERERAEAARRDSEEVIASLDRKLEAMRQDCYASGRMRDLPDGSTLTLSDEAWEREQAERRARGDEDRFRYEDYDEDGDEDSDGFGDWRG
jgi:hypothetical protein